MMDSIQHDWHEENFIVAKARGKRYHYDIKRPDLWNVVVSNGTTEWNFQSWKNEYVQRPTPSLAANASLPDDAIRASTALYAQN
jgi:hypothetical protein